MRLAVGALALVLAYGAAVHVGQLVAGGRDPYPWAPTWLAAYFVSLTLFDALAAALLAARRRAGLRLAVAVLVTDALANAYAIYGLGTGGPPARVAQAVITALALAAAAAAPRLSPWLHPRPAGGGSPTPAAVPRRGRGPRGGPVL